MALDISALAAYTEEQNYPLIVQAITGEKTAGLMTVQPGVKSVSALNLLDSNAIFQEGRACSFTPSGDTTLTQRDITVGSIKVNEDICVKTLETIYIQTQLPTGAYYEEPSDIPFEVQWTNLKSKRIASQNEVALWQGSTLSGNTNLLHFDGFLRIIDVAAASVDGNPGAITVATGITAANVEGIMYDQAELMPEAVLNNPDLGIFCGLDTFRIWTRALTVSNLFHYTGENDNFELVVPGTNIRVYGVPGLTGTNRIISGSRSNFFIGTDLLNDAEDFRVWYSMDDDVVKFKAEWKLGTQLAYPGEVVQFTLVP